MRLSCGTCGATEYCSADYECIEACNGAECGTLSGVVCGLCAAREWCTGAHSCEDACGNAECGTRLGADCGTCGRGDWCTAEGACQDACGGAECGTRHGRNCGSCEASESCDASGKCAAHVCEPSANRCDDLERLSCSADGLTETSVEVCGSSQCCSPDGCTGKVCTPGWQYCTQDDVLAHCDTTGCGPNPGGTDCAALGASCSVSYGCFNHDVIKADGSTSPNGCYLDSVKHSNTGIIIKVTKTVRLIDFEQSFYVKNDVGTMRWLVYEADSLGGVFTEKYSRTQSISPTPEQSGRPIRAGAIDVLLEAGKYYLIGSECANTWNCHTFANYRDGGPDDPSFGTVEKQLEFGCESLGATFRYDASLDYASVYDFATWTQPVP